MSINLLTGKRARRNWSISVNGDEPAMVRVLEKWGFTLGILGGVLGGLFVGYQVGAAAIEKRYGVTQSQHLRAKNRSR